MARIRSRSFASKVSRFISDDFAFGPGQKEEYVSTYFPVSQTITDDDSPFDPSRYTFKPCLNTKTSYQLHGSPSFSWTRDANSAQFHREWGEGLIIDLCLSTGVPDVIFPGDVNASKIRDYCLQQCVSKVDQTPYAFAEDLATIKETYHFLRNPLSSIADIALAFNKFVQRQQRKGRRGRLSDAVRLSRAISSAWAEYRFAFRPLLKSSHDALEALFRELEGRRKHRKDKAVVHFRKKSSSDSSLDVQITTRAWNITAQRDLEYFASIAYRVSNPVDSLGWTLGLRANDVPKLMWDLVPYSFMLDRMLDIGSAIQGFVNLTDPNISILGACTTAKTTTVQSKMITQWNLSGYTPSSSSSGSVEVISTTYDRLPADVSVSSVIPSFMPDGLIDTSTKLADLVALSVQRLRVR